MRIVILLTIILFGCHHSKHRLIERNNEIVQDINAFYSIHDSLFDFLAKDTNPAVCIQQYEKLLKSLQHFRSKYEKMVPLENSNLEEATKQFFQKYDSLARNDYGKLLNYLTRPMYEFTKADIQSIDSLYHRIDSIQNVIDEFLSVQQKLFFQKFQLTEL